MLQTRQHKEIQMANIFEDLDKMKSIKQQAAQNSSPVPQATLDSIRNSNANNTPNSATLMDVFKGLSNSGGQGSAPPVMNLQTPGPGGSNSGGLLHNATTDGGASAASGASAGGKGKGGGGSSGAAAISLIGK